MNEKILIGPSSFAALNYAPKQKLIDEVGQTKKAVTNALDKMSESDFKLPYPSKSPIPDATSLIFLTHLYGHLGYHLGQINYHRRLLA